MLLGGIRTREEIQKMKTKLTKKTKNEVLNFSFFTYKYSSLNYFLFLSLKKDISIILSLHYIAIAHAITNAIGYAIAHAIALLSNTQFSQSKTNKLANAKGETK